MTTTTRPQTRMFLEAETAGELMTENPLSIGQSASLTAAAVLLADHGFGAAPVIDEAGRPVGVVSQADLVVHQREHVACPAADPAVVADIMTPTVFTVPMDAPAAEVVRLMLELQVHRLFVTDAVGTLVGVIGLFDLLRHMAPSPLAR